MIPGTQIVALRRAPALAGLLSAIARPAAPPGWTCSPRSRPT